MPLLKMPEEFGIDPVASDSLRKVEKVEGIISGLSQDYRFSKTRYIQSQLIKVKGLGLNNIKDLEPRRVADGLKKLRVQISDYLKTNEESLFWSGLQYSGEIREDGFAHRLFIHFFAYFEYHLKLARENLESKSFDEVVVDVFDATSKCRSAINILENYLLIESSIAASEAKRVKRIVSAQSERKVSRRIQTAIIDSVEDLPEASCKGFEEFHAAAYRKLEELLKRRNIHKRQFDVDNLPEYLQRNLIDPEEDIFSRRVRRVLILDPKRKKKL